MENAIEYALYEIEGGMKLVKTFNSLDELIEYGMNNDVNEEVFRVANPAMGLVYNNIFQCEDHFFTRVSLKQQLDCGDIDEEEYENEIRRVVNREKRDLKEFLASQPDL